MAEEKYPKSAAFVFLESIRQLFTSRFSEQETNNAIAYNLNESFKNDLKSRMVKQSIYNVGLLQS